MHSVLEPLAKQLRQKNYRNFMKSMIAFFAIRNLPYQAKLWRSGFLQVDLLVCFVTEDRNLCEIFYS